MSEWNLVEHRTEWHHLALCVVVLWWVGRERERGRWEGEGEKGKEEEVEGPERREEVGGGVNPRDWPW